MDHFNRRDEQDHESVDFSSSSSDDDTGTGLTQSDDSREELVKEESHAVFRSKRLVYMFLLLAAIGVGVSTYLFLREGEEDAMKTEFDARSRQVFDQMKSNVQNSLHELEDLSKTITSFSKFVGCSWPNCTIPDFEARTLREYSAADFVGFAPIVPASQKLAWEQYSMNHQGWIEQDLQNRNEHGETRGPVPIEIRPLPAYEGDDHGHDHDDDHSYYDSDHEDASADSDSDNLHNHHGHDHRRLEEREHYLPLWQFSPFSSQSHELVKVDLFSHSVLGPLFEHAMQSKEVIQSGTFDLSSLTLVESDKHPRNALLYPVLDHFEGDSRVVGYVFSVLSWDRFLEGIIKDASDRVIVEVEETCGDGFFYEIPNPSGILSGFGGFGESPPDKSLEAYRQSMNFLAFSFLDEHENHDHGDEFGHDEHDDEKRNYNSHEDHEHEEGHEEHEDDENVGHEEDEDHHEHEHEDLDDGDHEDHEDLDDLDHEEHDVYGQGSHDHACTYTLHVLPTRQFVDHYTSNDPILYALFAIGIFAFTAMVFLTYDVMVERRQRRLLSTARQTDAIVASLFPRDVQRRIMKDVEDQVKQEQEARKAGNFFSARSRLQNLASEADSSIMSKELGLQGKSKPVADFFPEASIMFADIAGFTAWSSTREPTQVFELLESVYGEFDAITKRRRIFKVETIGDCYVAASGLPTKRRDHATAIVRFADDCLRAFNKTVRSLERRLGPDTADLGLRVGVHSGPVTAGVLRGDKARFQLFGDTVNTCARIESTGERNKIHLSEETADLLIAAGRGNWVHTRADRVQAKGKGQLTTFWFARRDSSDNASNPGGSVSGETVTDKSDDDQALSSKTGIREHVSDKKCQRLVEWVSDILRQTLKSIKVRRLVNGIQPAPASTLERLESVIGVEPGVLNEILEVIQLPSFKQSESFKHGSSTGESANDVELDPVVSEQVVEYVYGIASMYQDNPFHNFEHAAHVTMSVTKLLSRIIAPELDDLSCDQDKKDNLEQEVHDHTYGITSDPLTQFACVLSALIHDTDHQGVPNTQLVRENQPIAKKYKGQSVAEQNSVDLAWDLLMQDRFKDLRRAIYCTEEEFARFRHLVVNSVIATDIMDKSLKELRNLRWDKAFHPSSIDSIKSNADEDTNRKATIVIEHLIQASDVSHTMQHWHVYRKWNERLFVEMYTAYKQGRTDKNPADSWYKGEIGFFDFYIIPLAKKLKDCGVFGVSSDEYLKYAQCNRREWEAKGESCVSEMLEKVSAMDFSGKSSTFRVHDNERGVIEVETVEI